MSTPSEVIRSTPKKRLIIRGLLMLAYITLAILVFVNGRGHTLLLDNKSAADGSYAGLRIVDATVNNQDPVQLTMRERVKATVIGQKHRIAIDVAGQRYEATFKVPFGEDFILVSLPRLAAGIDPFWEPFRSEVVAPPPAEEEPLPTLDSPAPIGG
ncbi:MAG: hypothetical protein JXM71_08005 [Spirochaetales bacterium]|nr:hypothetical protein [Spirochaetales bacterium]